MSVSDEVTLGRNQFDLLVGALNGLLSVLVEDPDAPTLCVRDPWEGAGIARSERMGTGPTWNAIFQAKGVLDAAKQWPVPVPQDSEETT